jgi:hypothetical protein
MGLDDQWSAPHQRTSKSNSTTPACVEPQEMLMNKAKSTPQDNPPRLTDAERVHAYIDALATSGLWHNPSATAVLAGSISGSPAKIRLGPPAVHAPMHRPQRLSLLRRAAARLVARCHGV